MAWAADAEDRDCIRDDQRFMRSMRRAMHGAAAKIGAATIVSIASGALFPIRIGFQAKTGRCDLKSYVCGKAITAAQGLVRLLTIVRQHQYMAGAPPKVLLVAPAPLSATNNADFADIMTGAQAESQALPGRIQSIATAAGCHYFDAGTVAAVSPVDGLHLGLAATRSLGLALAGTVNGIFQSP